MPAFTRVYSDDQREAVAYAYIDRGLRPLKKVLRAAENGELLTPTGEPVAPFLMPVATARDYCAKERRRRTGRTQSALAASPKQTQAEQVRARLLAIADSELLAVERQVRGNKRPDTKRASAAAKLAREALALGDGSLTERPRIPEPRTDRVPEAAGEALKRMRGGRINAAPAQKQDAELEERRRALAEVERSEAARPGAEELARLPLSSSSAPLPASDAPPSTPWSAHASGLPVSPPVSPGSSGALHVAPGTPLEASVSSDR